MNLTKATLRSFTKEDYCDFPGVEGEDPKIIELNRENIGFENISFFIQKQLESRSLIERGQTICELTLIADKSGIYIQAFIDLGNYNGRTFYDSYWLNDESKSIETLEEILLFKDNKFLVIEKLVSLGFFNFTEN